MSCPVCSWRCRAPQSGQAAPHCPLRLSLWPMKGVPQSQLRAVPGFAWGCAAQDTHCSACPGQGAATWLCSGWGHTWLAHRVTQYGKSARGFAMTGTVTSMHSWLQADGTVIPNPAGLKVSQQYDQGKPWAIALSLQSAQRSLLLSSPGRRLPAAWNTLHILGFTSPYKLWGWLAWLMRVTHQAEQHIYQAQLLILGSSTASLLALADDAAQAAAFLLKLPSRAQAAEGQGSSLLLHFLSSFRKKLCRFTTSSKVVGHSCHIMETKSSEACVCVHRPAPGQDAARDPNTPGKPITVHRYKKALPAQWYDMQLIFVYSL